MVYVRDILVEKGSHMVTISPQAPVHTAVILMNDHKIGSLLVLEEGRLVGILTERDILLHVVAAERNARTLRVEEAMTRDVVCCRPHTSLEEARGVMKNRRVRHLPVLGEEDQVVGVISIGDLNAHQVTNQEQTIYLLQEYIHGHV
jgi:CBS domain-containing protein